MMIHPVALPAFRASAPAQPRISHQTTLSETDSVRFGNQKTTNRDNVLKALGAHLGVDMAKTDLESETTLWQTFFYNTARFLPAGILKQRKNKWSYQKTQHWADNQCKKYLQTFENVVQTVSSDKSLSHQDLVNAWGNKVTKRLGEEAFIKLTMGRVLQKMNIHPDQLQKPAGYEEACRAMTTEELEAKLSTW